MGDAENAQDLAFRNAVISVLTRDSSTAAPFLPVQVLIDVVLAYAMPFRGIVTTVAGGLSADATARTPLANPTGLCLRCDPKTGALQAVLIANTYGNGFVAYRFVTDDAIHLAGSGRLGSACGLASQSEFQRPSAICADPTNSNRYFLADSRSVRVLQLSTSEQQPATVKRLVGGDAFGYAPTTPGDTTTQFHHISDLLCSPDGRMLWISDSANHRVRACAIAVPNSNESEALPPPPATPMRNVIGDGKARNAPHRLHETMASLHAPKQIAFDAVPLRTDETVAIWIACTYGIARYSQRIKAQSVTFVNMETVINAHGLVSLPNGVLIASCQDTNAIYAVDPASGALERVAGESDQCGYANGSALRAARFRAPASIALHTATQALFVADVGNDAIRRVTLPPHLFDAH